MAVQGQRMARGPTSHSNHNANATSTIFNPLTHPHPPPSQSRQSPTPAGPSSTRRPPSAYRKTNHSRRTSMDSGYQAGQGSHHGGDTQSMPGSPLTYFPNPSTFTLPPGQHPYTSITSDSPRTYHSPIPGRPPSMAPTISSTDDEDGKGDRTPRTSRYPQSAAQAHLSGAWGAGDSSPRDRRSTATSIDLRRVSTANPLSANAASTSTSTSIRTTSTPGYGSTHHTPIGLGLGNPEHSQRVARRNGDALSSPRRISTSIPSANASQIQLQSSQAQARSPLPNPPITHEGYYSYSNSQPNSGTTPRFKDSRQGYTIPNNHLATPGASSGMHRRNFSIGSILSPSNPTPSSPSGSVMRRIRKTASTVGLSVGRPQNYDGDDHVNRPQDAGDIDDDEIVNDSMKANGTRVWYSSYVTIDWIHDAIKESARVRKLRSNAKKSYRNSIANTWDRFQGWLVVTIIGIISAVIAFLIIRAEMALFDLKEGFCTTSWGTAKRFCCAPHHRRLPDAGDGEEICGDWIEWGDFFQRNEIGGYGSMWGGPEFLSYGLVAVSLAVLASTMTIYLSASHHTTSKDSTFLLPPTDSPVAKQAKNPEGQTMPIDERVPLLASSSSMSGGDEQFERKVLEVEPPRKVMYYAAGSGIPEIRTILSGFVIHGYLGGWTLITKSVGLALSVASGLSLGKEGPLVHISCCVGNIVSRLFLKFECNEAKRREVLSAACAAGVSVAFGAPIGGVLFSLEEVSYYFPPKVMWRSFWCAAVAAITLKSLNPFGNGSLVLFAVSYTKEYHYWEFAIFIVLGIFGGLYGALFARLNILWSKHVRAGTWVKHHPIVEVLLVTVLTTVVSFLNPYCRMGGTELVASLFAECKDDSSSSLCVQHPREIASVMFTVGSALVIKGALTIITFGIKLPAGIFIPSLVVGACFGRIVGLGMEYIEFLYPNSRIFGVCSDTECIVPGLYAMVGAAATLAGVTRTTVSLAVIVIELTGTLNYVVPIMLGVLVAKTVADGLEKKGIYDLVIDLNQLPFLDSKHEYLWGGRTALEVADREIPIIRADKPHTVRTLTGKLLELARKGMIDGGFPVLTKEIVEHDGRSFAAMRIVGFLGMNELEHALGNLADEPDANLNLLPEDGQKPRASVMSIFSFAESYTDPRSNPYDISRYIDRAPITVQTHSSLELVQQLFVKLGARQIMVTDSRGVFRGIISKKAWLAFLSGIEGGH